MLLWGKKDQKKTSMLIKPQNILIERWLDLNKDDLVPQTWSLQALAYLL